MNLQIFAICIMYINNVLNMIEVYIVKKEHLNLVLICLMLPEHFYQQLIP